MGLMSYVEGKMKKRFQNKLLLTIIILLCANMNIAAEQAPKIVKLPPHHFMLKHAPNQSSDNLLDKGADLIHSIIQRDVTHFLSLLPDSESILLETYENQTATKTEIEQGMHRWQDRRTLPAGSQSLSMELPFIFWDTEPYKEWLKSEGYSYHLQQSVRQRLMHADIIVLTIQHDESEWAAPSPTVNLIIYLVSDLDGEVKAELFSKTTTPQFRYINGEWQLVSLFW
jgi:hypothetical protein